MLQMDDLRQVVTEIVEEVCTKRGLNEKPSVEEGEWLTREEVCDMLHITYSLYVMYNDFACLLSHQQIPDWRFLIKC